MKTKDVLCNFDMDEDQDSEKEETKEQYSSVKI